MNATVTLPLDQLRELLTRTAPFADKSDILPALNAILLRGHGDKGMSAVSTDRYRMAMARIETACPEDFEALVPLAVARAILATFKPRRGLPTPDVTLTVTEQHRLAVEVAGGLGLALVGAVMSYRLQEGEFPAKSVTKMLGEALLPCDPIPAGIGLNPTFLADFKAVGGLEPMLLGYVICESSQRPIKVTIGERFIGLIMPVRVDAPKFDWSPLLPAAETATEAGAA